MIKIGLILINLSLSFCLAAQDNQLVIMGGGGEPVNASTTQFDESLKGLGEFYKNNKNKYQTSISFNGGHSQTEELITKNFGESNVMYGFTPLNFKILLDETLEKMKSMPPGKKVIVFINSHGTESKGNTHQVSTTGAALVSMNTGGEEALVSLDRLSELSELAQKNNLKLFILDGSCHAGATLSVANSHTCVVTASGPNHYATSVFADNFSKLMKTGKNVEEIFFEARKSIEALGFPMISTEAGIMAKDDIYPLLTPYMFYHDEYRGLPLDKIDTYLKSNARRSLVCEKNKDFEKLEEILLLIQDVDKVSLSNTDVKVLLKKLRDYKKTQDEYLEELVALELPALETKELIATETYPNGNYYTHKELLNTDYLYFVRQKENQLQNKDLSPKEAAKIESMRVFFLQAQKVKEGLFEKYPQYKQQEAIIARLKNDEKVSEQIASDIMKEAQSAFLKLYSLKEKELENGPNKRPNPCKDFVL